MVQHCPLENESILQDNLICDVQHDFNTIQHKYNDILMPFLSMFAKHLKSVFCCVWKFTSDAFL